MSVIPILSCAILFDLAIGKPNVRPTREMGEAAAAASTADAVKQGAIGAGTGATVGKIFGMEHAMKGGIGTATVNLSDAVRVAAGRRMHVGCKVVQLGGTAGKEDLFKLSLDQS